MTNRTRRLTILLILTVALSGVFVSGVPASGATNTPTPTFTPTPTYGTTVTYDFTINNQSWVLGSTLGICGGGSVVRGLYNTGYWGNNAGGSGAGYLMIASPSYAAMSVTSFDLVYASPANINNQVVFLDRSSYDGFYAPTISLIGDNAVHTLHYDFNVPGPVAVTQAHICTFAATTTLKIYKLILYSSIAPTSTPTPSNTPTPTNTPTGTAYLDSLGTPVVGPPCTQTPNSTFTATRNYSLPTVGMSLPSLAPQLTQVTMSVATLGLTSTGTRAATATLTRTPTAGPTSTAGPTVIPSPTPTSQPPCVVLANLSPLQGPPLVDVGIASTTAGQCYVLVPYVNFDVGDLVVFGWTIFHGFSIATEETDLCIDYINFKLRFLDIDIANVLLATFIGIGLIRFILNTLKWSM